MYIYISLNFYLLLIIISVSVAIIYHRDYTIFILNFQDLKTICDRKTDGQLATKSW